MPRATPPAPLSPSTVLLIVDMINTMDFDGGKAMLPMAIAAAKRVAKLKQIMKSRGSPVVYVNDNFTQWRAGFRELVAICSHDNSLGAPIATLLPPEQDDYFILKPKHSAFYASALPVLLEQLGATKLVVTGIAADGCVLATATDAHMRDYLVQVPRDCVASISKARTRRALELLESSMHIDTSASASRR